MFEVSGVTDTSKVTVDGTTVTFGAGSLGEADASLNAKDGNTYTLVLDSSYKAPATAEAGFDGNTYKAASTSAGWTQDGTKVTYSAASGGEAMFEVSGVSDTSKVTLSGTEVTFGAGSLGEADASLIAKDGKTYTLKLDESYKAPATTPEGFDGNTYKSAYTSAGYTQDGTTVKYSAATGGEAMFEVSGVADTAQIRLNGTTVTFGNGALGKENASLTAKDGKTHTIAALDTSTYPEPQTTLAHFDTDNLGAYKSTHVSEGWTLKGTNITYTPESGNETLFTLTGIKSTSGIGVSNDKVITLKASNLNKTNVTVDSTDYTLALSGVSKPTESTPAGFEGNTYKSAVLTEGYESDGKQTIT